MNGLSLLRPSVNKETLLVGWSALLLSLCLSVSHTNKHKYPGLALPLGKVRCLPQAADIAGEGRGAEVKY